MYFINNPDKAALQPLAANEIDLIEEAFSIPGTDDGLKIEYIVQINGFALDFFPKTIENYPPEIALNENKAAFTVNVAVTVAHPINIRVIPEIVSGKIEFRYEFDDYEILSTRITIWGLMGMEVVSEWEDLNDANSDMIDKLAFRIEKIEIQDITPTSLEEIIEVVARDVVQYGFLQNMKLPLKFLILDMFSISLEPTISPNPAINDDRAHIWLKATFVGD
jgi:hypothetical protein